MGGWHALPCGGVHVLQSALLIFGQQPRCMPKTYALRDDVRGHTQNDAKPEGQKLKGPISIFRGQGMLCHVSALVG